MPEYKTASQRELYCMMQYISIGSYAALRALLQHLFFLTIALSVRAPYCDHLIRKCPRNPTTTQRMRARRARARSGRSAWLSGRQVGMREAHA